MTRICVEIIGRNCSKCLEVSDCIKLETILAQLDKECGPIDPEYHGFIMNNSVVDMQTAICRDGVLKIIRLVRGG